MLRKLHFALLLLCTLLLSGTAFAATVTWTGKGTNNNWDNPQNWDTGYVPGVDPHTGDDVVLPPLKDAQGHDINYNVDQNIDVKNGNVNIGGDSGGTVTLRNKDKKQICKKLIINKTGKYDEGAGALTIQEDGKVVGELDIGPGATLDMPAGSTGVTVDPGGLTVFGGTPGDINVHGGSLTNNGTVSEDGNAGQVRIFADQGFMFNNNAGFTMNGNCCLHPGTMMPFPVLNNTATGVILINAGPNYNTFGFFTNNVGHIHLANGGIDAETGGNFGGVLQLDSGTAFYAYEDIYTLNGLTCTGTGYLGNTGATIDVAGNNTVPFYGQYSGATVLMPGSNLQCSNSPNFYGGNLGGSGTLNGNPILSGNTDCGPGQSPGILTINGNYTQGANNALNIQLAGTTAGSGYDQLNVTGTATLGGTLNVSQINGFTSNGGSYVIMKYGARNGTFATVNGLDLGNGRTLQLHYNATNITLVDPGTPVTTHAISGKITLNGAGFANVALKRTGSNTVATTDNAGNYSFTNVPAGSSTTITPTLLGYNFTPSARNVTVGNTDVTNQNFTAAVALFTIKGHIANTGGTAMPNVLVSCTGLSSVATDANGNYTFSNVHVGTYTIAPVHTASLNGVTFTPTSYTANVTTSNLTNLNFIAQFTITGKVSNSSGAGIPNLLVTRTQGGSAVTVTTDANGNFTFSNVRSGSYTIAPQIPPSMVGMSFNPASYNVTVNTTNLTNINFTAFFTVSGKVTTSSNVAMPNVLVRLNTSTSSTSVLTDSSGNYKFSNVRSGNYTVTPSQSGKTFSPTSKSVSVSTVNLSSVNFIGS
jgi:hypothetical protein